LTSRREQNSPIAIALHSPQKYGSERSDIFLGLSERKRLVGVEFSEEQNMPNAIFVDDAQISNPLPKRSDVFRVADEAGLVITAIRPRIARS
jgi:hypothetical protein